MQPEILKLQAFGPYVSQQCIDFHAFAKQHVFLIQGETGSGKTMLLDAMTYALYGKSSGGQREDLLSMRSRFAEASKPTIVDFQFRLKGHTYRFVRTITMRRKRNQKDYNAMLQVDAGEVVNGQFLPFFENPKQRNVEEKAEELLGLTHAQFIQVMILPQGKFEQLLTSKSEEKQEILRTLFQMERWTNINGVLSEMMKQKKEELDAKKQRKEALLSGIPMQNIEDIASWLQSASQQKKQLQEQCNHLQQQVEQIVQKINKEKQRREQAERLKQAQRQWMELNRQEAEMHALSLHLQRQQELLKVLSPWEELQKSQQQLQRRQQEYQLAQAKLQEAETCQQQLPALQQQITQLKQEEQTIEQQLHAYEEMLPSIQLRKQLSKQRLQEQQKLEQAQTAQQQEQQQLLALQQQAEGILERLAKGREQIAELQNIGEQANVWQQAHYHEQQRCTLQQERQKERKQLATLAAQIALLKQQLAPLAESYEQQVHAYLTNSAERLASLLKDQEPCPVCGSLHHPSPAQLHGAYYDVRQLQQLQEEVDQKKEDMQMLMQQQGRMQAHVQWLTSSIQEHEANIISLLRQPFSMECYTHIQKQKDQWEALQKRQEELIACQQQNEQQQQQQKATLEACKEACSKQQMDLLLLEQRIATLQSSLPQLSEAQLQEHMQTLKQQQAAQKESCAQMEARLLQWQQEIIQRKQDHHHAKEEFQQAQQTFHEAEVQWQSIRNSGIQDHEMEALKPADLQAEKQRLHTYELQKEQLRTRLQDLQKHNEEIKEKDLAQLQQQYQQVQQQQNELRNQMADISSHEELYTRTMQSLQQIQQELEVEEPKLIEMAQFVKAMRGDTGMGIERYVLGVMLSSITQQANQLLRLVHHGRYQIFRSDEASGRTRKYGLELSIYDSYTCNSRSVVSLSGGEKFLVSLALSLALSSVVQARNGGIQLDTMFIDEGFGSLDEHSIADALAVLQQMSNTRGYVGIISHVELLKENIPCGVFVKKSREGSNIEIRKV